MRPVALKTRVESRDRLLLQAENVERLLNDQVLGAFARGEMALAEAAARHHDSQLRDLTENLRVYQAELHAQADELDASQARTQDLANRFATLFSSMPVAALLVAANGEVTEYNAMAGKQLSLNPRMAARFLHRLVDNADYQDRVRPAFHEALASGESALSGIAFYGENGRRFVGDLHIASLPGASQRGGQFACAVIDRTEHIQHLKALADSAEQLRQGEAALADSARLARIGGWQIDLRPRAFRWSRELRSILDVAPDQAATLETLLDLCVPADRALLAQALAAAELGMAFEIEIDMLSATGRPLRVLAVGHADGLPGAVRSVNGVLQDITSQHLVRGQISDLTERLAMANDAGGIGVWDWDLVEGTVHFDARLCDILGIRQQPAGGLTEGLMPHLRPTALAQWRSALAQALERLEPLNVELLCAPAAGPRGDGRGGLAHSGAERWLHITGRAHADACGRVVRLIGCAWDSSPVHEAMRLLAAKDAADSASQAKSAFLSRMSHELRTPLNAILGFSQLMRLEADSGDLTVKPHRVELIESAARHLLELVNEVLDVSRIESGRLALSLVPCELSRLVAESTAMVQGLATRHEVVLVDRAREGPDCRVMGDPLRVKEVLINLLTNAIKYNRPGGQVTIDVQPTSADVVVQVSDTGRGLDERQLAGLFQPFDRVGAESSGIEGSGMGLFVSRRFVELMGGDIEVSSQPGVGTVVRVRLSVAPAAQATGFLAPAA
jgi:signal transduction histidine kinase